MKIIAVDIETDTSPLTEAEKAAGYTGYTQRGLDPRITPITSIALATQGDVTVLEGTEAELLNQVDMIVESAFTWPALLVTWNGSVFDLPFIQDRARIDGEDTTLGLTPNPAIIPKYAPTPGHAGGYSASWGTVPHIDIAYVVKADAEARGVKWSLKPYARSIGLDPIEVDRTKMHELTPQEQREYVASDAVMTLEIAKRALGLL